MGFEGFGKLLAVTVGDFGLASGVLFVAWFRHKHHNSGPNMLSGVLILSLVTMLMFAPPGAFGFVLVLLILSPIDWTFPIPLAVAAGLLFWGIRKRNFWLEFAGFFMMGLIAVYFEDDPFYWQLPKYSMVSTIIAIWLIALIIFIYQSRSPIAR